MSSTDFVEDMYPPYIFSAEICAEHVTSIDFGAILTKNIGPS